MSIEKDVRLGSQALAGEAAEEALPIVSQAFAELRAEAYRQMEEPAPDMPLIHAKLRVMRALEEKLGAYVRNGKIALKDLQGGDNHV